MEGKCRKLKNRKCEENKMREDRMCSEAQDVFESVRLQDDE